MSRGHPNPEVVRNHQHERVVALKRPARYSVCPGKLNPSWMLFLLMGAVTTTSTEPLFDVRYGLIEGQQCHFASRCILFAKFNFHILF